MFSRSVDDSSGSNSRDYVNNVNYTVLEGLKQTMGWSRAEVSSLKLRVYDSIQSCNANTAPGMKARSAKDYRK